MGLLFFLQVWLYNSKTFYLFRHQDGYWCTKRKWEPLGKTIFGKSQYIFEPFDTFFGVDTYLQIAICVIRLFFIVLLLILPPIVC